MKKIPTLFKRECNEKRLALNIVTRGCEWVLAGDGEATEKVDGAACAIINGKFYRRYIANEKKGKRIPPNAIPCQDTPDRITGDFPCWVEINRNSNADKWYVAAYYNSSWINEDGTYEAVGTHFHKNPYGLDGDFLERHGRIKIKDCPRDYDGIREYLASHEIEGIVFWKDGKPGCKIKRSDFGFEWPIKKNRLEETAERILLNESKDFRVSE